MTTNREENKLITFQVNLPDYVFTVAETAKILKTNKNYIYDLIRKKHISALKLGSLKITKDEIERFLKEYTGKDLSDLDNVKELKVM